MTELVNLVNCLVETLKSKPDIVKDIVPMLQQIGAELLTKYEIRVNDLTIEPLRVEPYLYKKDIFEDKFIHCDHDIYGAHQRNRFGKLYIHKGYSGIDIVLSNSEEYAFSFLVKNSRILVDGKIVFPFVKQYGVAKTLKDHKIPFDYDEIALYKKDAPNNAIVFRTIRNGLTNIAERCDFRREDQSKYNDLVISSFIELKEHKSSQYDFEKGYGKEWAVANYIANNNIQATDNNIKELLGYYSSNVKSIVEKNKGLET